MTAISESLAAAVAAAGIESTPDFEALVLKLTPPERALYVALANATTACTTLELRAAAGGLLSNVSGVAAAINRKLADAGDERRLVCTTRPRAAGRGSDGLWRIEAAQTLEALP